MRKVDLSKVCKVNGKVSAAERKAGILVKLTRLPNGFWLCWVRADSIRADVHQRDLDEGHVDDIVDKFDPLCVNLPTCTCRIDGMSEGVLTSYVEDGNHTIHMLNHLKLTEDKAGGMYQILEDGKRAIMCMVNFEVNHQQAANVFFVRNTAQKRIVNWVSFRAGHAAGHYYHRVIMEQAKANGLVTPLDKGKVDLCHWNEYLLICKRRGVSFLTELFMLHAKTFKGQDHSREFLKGLVKFLQDNKLSPKDMIQRMRGYDGLVEAVKNKGWDYSQTDRVSPSNYAAAIHQLFPRRAA